MGKEKRVVTLTDFEQHIMVRGLTDFRNDVLREGRPTEDVDGLILKVIDAPPLGPPRNRRFRGERSRSGAIELSPEAEAKDTELAATKRMRGDHEAR